MGRKYCEHGAVDKYGPDFTDDAGNRYFFMVCSSSRALRCPCPRCRITALEARLKVLRDAVDSGEDGLSFIDVDGAVTEALYADYPAEQEAQSDGKA